MRSFTEPIFFGNEHCIFLMQLLHARLEEGADLAGGLQQPPHSTSEEEAQLAVSLEQKYTNDLKDVVRDLAMALTGEDIIFVGRPQA